MQDPSLVTNVVTPLTDEYLAVSCPDRDVAEIDGLLRSGGATEVNLVSES